MLGVEAAKHYYFILFMSLEFCVVNKMVLNKFYKSRLNGK